MYSVLFMPYLFPHKHSYINMNIIFIRKPLLKIVKYRAFTYNPVRSLSSDSGISSGEARSIARDVFQNEIKERDALLGYFVKNHIEKYTLLPITIIVTNYYLKTPANSWFQFMYSDKYMGSVAHVDNEEVYDKIRQHHLKEFLLNYVQMKYNHFLNVPNITIICDVKRVTNDVLWNGDESHQKSYVQKQIMNDRDIFSLGFINKS